MSVGGKVEENQNSMWAAGWAWILDGKEWALRVEMVRRRPLSPYGNVM
jgi:hypothetical protein